MIILIIKLRLTILSMLMNDDEIKRIGRDQKESHQLCKVQWKNQQSRSAQDDDHDAQ